MEKSHAVGDRIDRLDALGKLFQREFTPSVKELVVEGRSSHPLVVDVDPSSSCNMACPHCVDRRSRHGTQLSIDCLTRLAAEMSHMGVGAVVVVGGGEPLTHPDIDTFLAALGGHDLRAGLVTNGLELGSHIAAAAKHCSWVRVSLDAATPGTFSAVHGVAAAGFSLVTDAIKSLAATGTTVGMSFVVMKKNWREISRAYELALELGCSYIEFKPLVSPYSKRIIPLNSGDKRRAAAVVARLGNGETGIEVVLPESMKVALNGCVPQVKQYNECHACEVRTVITPSGVFPCSYHRGDSAFRLGDINKRSLADIWAGRSARQAPYPPRDCDFYCARHHINNVIDILLANKVTSEDIAAYLAETGEDVSEDSYFI